MAGKWITPKLLADALYTLPEEKRQAVLLYYFFDMTDVEIAELMNGTVGNSSPDKRGLLPYPVILAAAKGDLDAMRIIVQHYASYIAYLSTRKVRDEYGNTYCGIDEDMRERLQAELMRVVLNCKLD